MSNFNKNVWFIGVNSSYVHTNPAIRILAAKISANWTEFNINQHKDFVLRSLFELNPRVIAFSCYIWNIEYVLEIADSLKKILPDVKILLGGAEVSYDAYDTIKKYSFIDSIVCGEGESIIANAIDALFGAEPLPGVIIRRSGQIIGSEFFNVTDDLDSLGLPFENYNYDPDKIFYYESSRGCPYKCSYCLSGENSNLRYKSLNTVIRDINIFAEKNARLIKFVDRTFNADRERAYQILKYIIENQQFANCRFHFEIGLDLLDNKTFDLLSKESAQRIQFEAGIQTCNEMSLNLITRNTNTKKSLFNAQLLANNTNVELHLDLIAGLPGEDFNSFKNSFNKVYEVYPHKIHLGFLKVLKGSRLRKDAEKYGIIYRDKSPYEVLRTSNITADELFILKGISELLNRYYNNVRAIRALNYLTQDLDINPFDFYNGLYHYADNYGWNARPLSATDQFRMIMDYTLTLLSNDEYINFLVQLKKDYLSVKIKGAMPKRLAEL